MKKSIIAILAVFLAAALLVGAGSASTTIYPYTNVNTSAGIPNGAVLQLTTDGSVFVGVNNEGYINSTSFKVGVYKLQTATADHGDYFLTYPDADISIQLTNSTGSLIDASNVVDGTVSKTSGLLFTAVPKIAAYTPEAFLFTTPEGGQVTVFGLPSTGKTDGFKVYPLNNESTDFQKIATGTWKVQVKYNNTVLPGMPAPLLNGYSVKSFTVATTTDSITANKDKVTRGKSFLVTIVGTPASDVKVKVNLKEKEGLILPTGQLYVDYSTKTNDEFVIELPATGTATVQFDTSSLTKADKYKIEALFNEGLSTEAKKDVKVEVVKGAVTLVSDADSYYIGNKVTLSGTNTETDEVYLYIKGANKAIQEIPTEKGYVTIPSDPVVVKSDETWEKEFTIANKFDAGTYTVYAAASKFAYAKKSDGSNDDPFVVIDDNVQYETAAITLKQPFLSATAAANTIASGDKIKITGTVEGSPDELIYYVFGTNYYKYGTITPEDDSTYEVKVSTDKLATGQYFVVVQHPMYDKLFNVQPGDYGFYKNDANKNSSTAIYSFATNVTDAGTVLTARDQISDVTSRQIANAAQAVCVLIDEEYVDDIYVKLDFIVATATMSLNSVADQTQGATFKVSGTTNVKTGEDVTIDVISTKFQAEPKASISAASYLVATTKVVAGSNGVNTFEATFDGTPLAIDAYTVVAKIARSTGNDLQASTTFNIVKGAATPVPSTTGTAAPTTTAVPTQTSTPAKTPGFGALIALAGLGAVAVLVLRRQ